MKRVAMQSSGENKELFGHGGPDMSILGGQALQLQSIIKSNILFFSCKIKNGKEIETRNESSLKFLHTIPLASF